MMDGQCPAHTELVWCLLCAALLGALTGVVGCGSHTRGWRGVVCCCGALPDIIAIDNQGSVLINDTK